ncbi:hypothetical protein QOZ80_5BG0422660 [Eleusine coracana subsp. coracana]|nr:hypothetical protein QOZ80_5BG0422660 [Eleusine coracana subsp. coracana]
MAEEGEPAAAPLALTVGYDAGESAAAAANDFGLPAELVALLPADPFAQLDVARKITSMALAFRLGRVEAEAARLRAQLAERDAEAEDLRERVEQLDTALGVASARIRRAEEEKETLLTEKASLVNTVQKLNKDVAKLEVFKKTLMQSLQEDEDGHITAPKARVAEAPNFSPASSVAGSNSKVSQFSETASSVSDESRVDPDVPRPPRPSVFLSSYNGTPRMTPPDSPPRRHSISVTSMNMLNDRSSVFSGQYSSPFDAPSQTGRTRVDGKEFFRQVRNRLSYEQFSAFLANVKELNANRQTREETLRKADEIFGPENKDLYTIFGSLITRNIQ